MLWEWEGFCSFTVIRLEIFICVTMQLYPLGNNVSVVGVDCKLKVVFLMVCNCLELTHLSTQILTGVN